MVRKPLSSRQFLSFLSQLHFSDSSSAHDPVKPHAQPPVGKFAPPPSMSCSGRHVKPTMNIHLKLILVIMVSGKIMKPGNIGKARERMTFKN